MIGKGLSDARGAHGRAGDSRIIGEGRHCTGAFREILDSNLSELGDEIAKTDSKDYRERLHLRQDLLKRVLAQLEEA